MGDLLPKDAQAHREVRKGWNFKVLVSELP